MPTSNLALAPMVLHLVNLAATATREARTGAVESTLPISLLDVGPGRGKYGVLVPEYVTGPWELSAIEAEPSYITPVLDAIYDDLMLEDVLDLNSEALAYYDIVLMVDVLEHLPKPLALHLLDRINGHVVICTPEEWFQNPEADEYPSERHRSHWQAGDFPQHRVRDLSSLYGGLLVWLDRQP